ncbi:MAG: hypothetical protein ACOY4F_08415 [Thermodesulfobacteriota bacterium]
MNRPILFLAAALLLAPCGRQAMATEQSAAPAAETPRTGSAPSVTFPISPKSFHGIEWGTRLGDVKDMTVVEKNGPAAYARIPGMSPRLGDIPVTEVVYAFCNDRFAGSMTTFQGKDRLAAIRDLLTRRYGQPVKPDGPGENAGWPLGNVLIMLEYDDLLNVGTLNYVHVPEYAPCTAPAETSPPQAKP